MVPKSFAELARRHKAAAVAIANAYDVTLEQVITSPQLSGFATSVYIEANKQQVELPAKAMWYVGREERNGNGKRSVDYFEVAKQLVTKGA